MTTLKTETSKDAAFSVFNGADGQKDASEDIFTSTNQPPIQIGAHPAPSDCKLVA